MIKRNIFKMFASAVMLLLACSCSSDQELDIAGGGSATTELPGAVRFSLGGSAASVATTAAPAETQNVDEKKVTSLYAVVFKDVTPAAAAVAGSASTEDDSDTFFKCIDVLGSAQTLEDKKYLLKVCDKKDFGDYQICFVANYAEIKNTLSAWDNKKTVKDFKDLVVAQAPDTKPGMLMTSAFKAVKIGSTTKELGEVLMTRAMARVDVINTAEGVTVTQIKFVNRAIKTNLYNDAGTPVAGHLEPCDIVKSYNVNLVGSKTTSAVATNKCEGLIYTYEQLNRDASAPCLEITYTGKGLAAPKSDIIKFAKGDNLPVNLRRNHLYTVTLTNKGSVINFNVTVKDWKVNENITVPGSGVASGTQLAIAQYKDAKVGDIMLNDGTLVKGNVSSLSDYQKQNAIGVVAYIFAPGRAGASLKTKLGREPKGLVLALKNAGENVAWDKNRTSDIVTPQTTLASAYTNSNDGYDITQKVWSKNQPAIFVAFNAIKDYEKLHPTPSFTSGWYMPSLGEWADMLSNAGGLGGVDITSLTQSTEHYVDIQKGAGTASKKLNNAIEKVGDIERYDKIYPNSSDDWYWSSSEYSSELVYPVYFNSRDILSFLVDHKFNEQKKVRCVLAF